MIQPDVRRTASSTSSTISATPKKTIRVIRQLVFRSQKSSPLIEQVDDRCDAKQRRSTMSHHISRLR